MGFAMSMLIKRLIQLSAGSLDFTNTHMGGPRIPKELSRLRDLEILHLGEHRFENALVEELFALTYLGKLRQSRLLLLSHSLDNQSLGFLVSLKLPSDVEGSIKNNLPSSIGLLTNLSECYFLPSYMTSSFCSCC
jgi:hypothetical protein